MDSPSYWDWLPLEMQLHVLSFARRQICIVSDCANHDCNDFVVTTLHSLAVMSPACACPDNNDIALDVEEPPWRHYISGVFHGRNYHHKESHVEMQEGKTPRSRLRFTFDPRLHLCALHYYMYMLWPEERTAFRDHWTFGELEWLVRTGVLPKSVLLENKNQEML
jgi:hypothetical protein